MAAATRRSNILFHLHGLLLLSFQLAGLIFAESGKKTFIFVFDHHYKPAAFPTHELWYAAALSSSSSSSGILHVYSSAFSGFSAALTAEEYGVFRKHPAIVAVFEDKLRQLHTTRSPQFLGLRTQRGLWSEVDYGSDVIIGVFDTGIWPERRSFSDQGLGPVPARWKGVCQIGERFTEENCNKKIVGARFFAKGYEENTGGLNASVEFHSPRDSDGHGTHTASTAAGQYVFKANMFGYADGVAKGVAPKARIAVYKVCWKSGCFDSDILAAFDAAISDGVDVISVSIGGGSVPFYLDPIALGSFSAASHGIFIATSAGNGGPEAMSVANLAPWVTTVGAGTIDRNFPASLTLGDGRVISGVSLYSGHNLAGKMYPLVYPGSATGLSASLCMEGSLDPKAVRGKIVVCDRGNNPRVAKGMVVQKAGGVGMVLANSAVTGEGLLGDAHVLPSCTVGATSGDVIKAYISSTANPTATITFGGTILGIKPAPVVASFSARGPNGQTPEVLKPDLIAPGVNILAAWTDSIGPTGLEADTRKAEFNILSGTSMAAPHVGGAAALLKALHPDWNPAMIRSAMMTTADTLDNQLRILTDESSRRASTPLDFGAGQFNLERAMDPGLVYDISSQDYIDFLCTLGYDTNAIQVITKFPVKCAQKKRSYSGKLNYPGFSAVIGGKTKAMNFSRMVTNVGPANSVYTSALQFSSKGVSVNVNPQKLLFTAAGQKLSYTLSVRLSGGNVTSDDSAAYGFLSWSDSGGKHVVRSPIIVSSMQSF